MNSVTGNDRLYVTNRESWRSWLNEYYHTASQVWLVYPRKHTALPRVSYNDAVEEALCFGWIDSITKGIDQDYYSQRFTPRSPGSSFSQTNIERLRKLIAQELVMPEILEKIIGVVDEPFYFPVDIEAALRANEKAWENFEQYSGAYQRIRVAYVESARNRPGEFDKRLRHLIQNTKQNKQFGFGIETYY